MPEREKVIKALECCKRKDGNECKVCQYTENEYCTEDMAMDALALLKEQEGEWLDVDDEQNAFDCSICGAMVGRKCLYCPGCGAKMKNGTRAIVCV